MHQRGVQQASVTSNSLVVHELKRLSIIDKSTKDKEAPLEWSI